MARARRAIALTKFELAKYKRLLKLTDHIAPYVRFNAGREDMRYHDALAIIRAFANGESLRAVCMPAIKRLATENYHKRAWNGPRRLCG